MTIQEYASITTGTELLIFFKEGKQIQATLFFGKGVSATESQVLELDSHPQNGNIRFYLDEYRKETDTINAE